MMQITAPIEGIQLLIPRRVNDREGHLLRVEGRGEKVRRLREVVRRGKAEVGGQGGGSGEVGKPSDPRRESQITDGRGSEFSVLEKRTSRRKTRDPKFMWEDRP